uniref:SHR-BD domain-containing protein n=1 Tax=Macrostomum lignano TaxID=282301 RepID=A0A1I8JE80_9PLAT
RDQEEVYSGSQNYRQYYRVQHWGAVTGSSREFRLNVELMVPSSLHLGEPAYAQGTNSICHHRHGCQLMQGKRPAVADYSFNMRVKGQPIVQVHAEEPDLFLVFKTRATKFQLGAKIESLSWLIIESDNLTLAGVDLYPLPPTPFPHAVQVKHIPGHNALPVGYSGELAWLVENGGAVGWIAAEPIMELLPCSVVATFTTQEAVSSVEVSHDERVFSRGQPRQECSVEDLVVDVVVRELDVSYLNPWGVNKEESALRIRKVKPHCSIARESLAIRLSPGGAKQLTKTLLGDFSGIWRRVIAGGFIRRSCLRLRVGRFAHRALSAREARAIGTFHRVLAVAVSPVVLGRADSTTLGRLAPLGVVTEALAVLALRCRLKSLASTSGGTPRTTNEWTARVIGRCGAAGLALGSGRAFGKRLVTGPPANWGSRRGPRRNNWWSRGVAGNTRKPTSWVNFLRRTGDRRPAPHRRRCRRRCPGLVGRQGPQSRARRPLRDLLAARWSSLSGGPARPGWRPPGHCQARPRRVQLLQLCLRAPVRLCEEVPSLESRDAVLASSLASAGHYY